MPHVSDIANVVQSNGNGKWKDWFIKLLAGAAVVALISWAQWITQDHFAVAAKAELTKQREQDHYERLRDDIRDLKDLLKEEHK